MPDARSTWTLAHDLALIFISMTYGKDHVFAEPELEQMQAALARWHDDSMPVEEVVLEGLAIFSETNASDEVLQSITSVGERLSVAEQQDVLETLVRIAEADGIILGSEKSFITTLARLWGIKEAAHQLIEQSTVDVEESPRWSLLHDIGLMYLIMAHSTDNDLTKTELDIIITRLAEWNPDLEVGIAEDIFREVIGVYAAEPDRRTLKASIASIKQQLPLMQRLVLLDDLDHIARADGPIDQYEADLLTILANAWEVGVRLKATPVS